MNQENIGGNIIYCSDPRQGNANLWKHIKRLLIPADQRFTPVGLLGAPVALARPADFPVKFAAVMEDIEFARQEFAGDEFKVVAHDCGIYKRLAPRQFTLQDKMDDAAKAGAFLRERFPGALVSVYFFKSSKPEFEQIS